MQSGLGYGIAGRFFVYVSRPMLPVEEMCRVSKQARHAASGIRSNPVTIRLRNLFQKNNVNELRWVRWLCCTRMTQVMDPHVVKPGLLLDPPPVPGKAGQTGTGLGAAQHPGTPSARSMPSSTFSTGPVSGTMRGPVFESPRRNSRHPGGHPSSAGSGFFFLRHQDSISRRIAATPRRRSPRERLPLARCRRAPPVPDRSAAPCADRSCGH